MRSLLMVLGSLVFGSTLSMADTAEIPMVARALLARLRTSGRAEAQVVTVTRDPLDQKERTVRGRLAMELPHFARLDFPSSGESITLREDGGDWLQPTARQLIRGGRQSAEAAMKWWGALLARGELGLEERKLGPRLYRLTHAASGGTGPTQLVTLGRDSLPSRIDIETEAGERIRYRIERWRFLPGKGRIAFVLALPPGYEEIELP